MIAPSLAQPGSSRQLVSFGRPVLARLAGRFVCFLAAGALGTACHYLVLIALVELAALSVGDKVWWNADKFGALLYQVHFAESCNGAAMLLSRTALPIARRHPPS